MRPAHVTALAALALSAAPAMAQDAATPSTSAAKPAAAKPGSAKPAGTTPVASNAMPTTARPYVQMAGAGDLYEIQSSRLALQKSQNAAVRQFAQMMIDHHGMTTQEITAAARAAGLQPEPPALQDAQARMLSELQPLSGSAFDTAYLDQQRMAHQMALALHSGYGQSGDAPALKQAAVKAVPIVQQHIDQLQSITVD